MRALSGIQPTNILHIGNLFGALLPAVALQDEYELFMMVADYHAITVPQDPKALNDNIIFITAAYLAAGIDPARTTLLQQSRIPEHAELGWILQTLTQMGEAERMTQFKEKSEGKPRVSVGLFTYPMLMAADILLYKSEVVPVGEDQKQHIELARNLAERFNQRFGETLIVPEPKIRERGARILSLTEPEKKMSKSAASARSYLSILDTEDIIQKKIRSATTDSEREITADPSRKGLYNLLTILHLVTGTSIEELAHNYRDRGMKVLKDDLAGELSGYLARLQADIHHYLNNKDELEKILRQGSTKAQIVAKETLAAVKTKMGFTLSR